MSTKLFDVIGLGASTLDILSLVDHFPSTRENQQARAMVIEGGGPVATAIVAVARLGGRSAMIDSLGDDWAGNLVVRGFESEGVDTTQIECCPGLATSISTILVSAQNGDRAIMWLPGSVPDLALTESHRSAIRSAKFLHLNGGHFQACMDAVKVARAADVRVSFDGGANRFRPELRSLLPLVDICIVAHDFAAQYTGETDAPKAAARLLHEGPQIAAVTDGKNGSWFCARDGASFHQPAFLLPASIDTTACGDAFHGAFLAAS